MAHSYREATNLRPAPASVNGKRSPQVRSHAVPKRVDKIRLVCAWKPTNVDQAERPTLHETWQCRSTPARIQYEVSSVHPVLMYKNIHLPPWRSLTTGRGIAFRLNGLRRANYPSQASMSVGVCLDVGTA